MLDILSRKLYEKEAKIITNTKRLLAILRHCVFGILIAVLVFVTIYKTLHRGELVKFNGMGILIVVSGSMEPTIASKEMIIIKEQTEYIKGDVITYKDDTGVLITHRIIDIEGSKVKTKGDNNNEPDDIIELEVIVGKVIFHSYILGIFFLYMLKPLLILIIILYFLYVLLK